MASGKTKIKIINKENSNRYPRGQLYTSCIQAYENLPRPVLYYFPFRNTNNVLNLPFTIRAMSRLDMKVSKEDRTQVINFVQGEGVSTYYEYNPLPYL